MNIFKEELYKYENIQNDYTEYKTRLVHKHFHVDAIHQQPDWQLLFDIIQIILASFSYIEESGHRKWTMNQV
jgi:hypothetical protein